MSDTKLWVLARKTDDLEVIDQLIQMRNFQASIGLAENPHLTEEHFHQLGKRYKSKSVLIQFANNSSLPPSAYQYLRGTPYAPYGLVRGKPIDDLVKVLGILDQNRGLISAALLVRLVFERLEEDVDHPKRKPLMMYVYAICKEEAYVRPEIMEKAKRSIKFIYPEDQEVSEALEE